MIFLLLTQELYTNEGLLIKKMHCPLQKEWEALAPVAGKSAVKHCQHCSKKVLDTAGIPEEALLRMVQKKPELCLKIDLEQANLDIRF